MGNFANWLEQKENRCKCECFSCSKLKNCKKCSCKDCDCDGCECKCDKKDKKDGKSKWISMN